MSFRSFRSHCDSRVEWIGDVPPHWTIRRLGSLFQETIDEAEEDLPVLSVSIHDGVSDREMADHELDRKITRSEDKSKYQKVVPGDLVYNMMRAWQGGFGTVTVLGLVSPAYVVARPIAQLETRFIELALRTPHAVEEMRRYSKGVTDFRLRLYWDEFKQICVPLPPAREIQEILAFLDHETAKIDALVAEQERLIVLLKEKRQAVISDAVTKGLDPNAPMKDSGVEWLGQVPAHWEVVPLSRVTISRCDGPFGSGLKTEHYTDDGVRVVRLQNIKVGEFDAADGAYIDPVYYAAQLIGHDVKEDDILIAGLGDERNIVGRACVAPPGIEPAMVKADCFRFRLDTRRALPAFIALQLSAGAPYDAGMLSTGSTRSRIPLSTMAARKTIVPPIKEQKQIVAMVDVTTARLCDLLGQAETAVALLRERRAALISAAVTGKIDVRAFRTRTSDRPVANAGTPMTEACNANL